jgi:hypothetical protein
LQKLRTRKPGTFASIVLKSCEDERIKKDRGIEHQLPVDIDRYTGGSNSLHSLVRLLLGSVFYRVELQDDKERRSKNNVFTAPK